MTDDKHLERLFDEFQLLTSNVCSPGYQDVRLTFVVLDKTNQQTNKGTKVEQITCPKKGLVGGGPLNAVDPSAPIICLICFQVKR